MPRVKFELWALPAGGDAQQLPDLAAWEVSPSDVGDWGSLSFDYPIDGKRYDLLAALAEDGVDVEVEAALTGPDGRQWLSRGLLLDIDTDDVAETGRAKVTGVLLEYLLSEVVVPYHPTGENGETELSGTAGFILRTLLQAAQARGCLAGVTWAFTDSHDSNGQPWERTATVRFSPGQTYAAVLGTLRGYQLSSWGLTHDRVLTLVNPEGKGVDRTTGPNPLTLEFGRDLGDAPRKVSLRNAITDLLSAGKDGLYSQASNATARARRGRRIEAYSSFGSAAAQGTLDALTQARVNSRGDGTTAISHRLTLAEGGPIPLLDFGLSDWVYSATRRGVERRRVVQITVSGDGDGAVDAAVDLNAVVDDHALAQAQRLDALENGTTVVGTSTPPADADDGSTPPQVSGLVVTSLWYSTGEGVGLASVLAGWSSIPDSRIDGYHVEWRYLDEPIPPASPVATDKAAAAAAIRDRILSGQPIAEDWTWDGAPAVVGQWNDTLLDEWIEAGRPPAATWLGTYAPASTSSGWRREPLVAGTSTSWGAVTAGAGIRVRVAAQNKWGRLGPWSDVVEMTTETDGTPPPVASAFALATRVGQVWGTWDGRGAVGEAMPGDFLRAEIHRSTTNGFTPHRPLLAGGKQLDEDTSTTYRGELRAGMTFPDQMAPGDHGTTFYYRLVLVDRSHNAAVAGAQTSIVAVPVQDGEVATIAAGKITAGIIDALVGIGQRLYAGTVNGPGWEGDPAGFRFYTGTGSARRAVLEFIANTGALTMLGRLISGAGVGVGSTVVVDPTDAAVDLYPTATTQRTRLRSRVTARPGGGGTAAGFEIETLNASGQTDGFSLSAWSSNLWIGHKLTSGLWSGARLVLERTGVARMTAGDEQGYVQVTANGDVDLQAAPGRTVESGTPMGGSGAGFSFRVQGLTGLEGYRFAFDAADNCIRIVDNASNGWVSDGAGGRKSFVIPHPVDPDRWLVHVATESPEALVEYHGEAEIVDGAAVVELPAYFEALTDPDRRTVQATMLLPDEPLVRYVEQPAPPTGMPGAQRPPVALPEFEQVRPVAVSRPREGRFRVACNAPDGTLVAWHVIAARRDQRFDVEPHRDAVNVHGDGPYRYLTPREGTS